MKIRKKCLKEFSRNIARVEKNYNPKADTEKLEEDFYSMMVGLDFLPNSPTLMNAGRDLRTEDYGM